MALRALLRRDSYEASARIALFGELADHFKNLFQMIRVRIVLQQRVFLLIEVFDVVEFPAVLDEPNRVMDGDVGNDDAANAERGQFAIDSAA